MHVFRLLTLLVCIVLFLPACQKEPGKLFELLPASKTGVDFKNLLKETPEFNVLKYGYFYNGGGVAVGDVNNDGLPDIYFTGNLVASKLYINRGDFEFEEIAEEAGVSAAGLWNTGSTMADVNGDGWLDIYVCRSAATSQLRRENLLFINNGPSKEGGEITFSEHAKFYGVNDQGYSTQAAFFDYDRDGDLDLYLLNHSVQEYAGFSQLTSKYKERNSPFYSDKLYRNELIPSPDSPPGGFTDMTREAGILRNVLGFGLGVAISDLNRDGWMDIYISNDYNEQDYLYINQQDGTFSEQLADYFDHVSLFSMGSDVADINHDGLPDLVTLDMLPESHYRQKMTSGPDNYDKYQRLVSSGFHKQSMRNMLQLNNGNQSFSEIGQLAGISNTDWSWSALMADYDLDGFTDLFVTNGYEKDYTNMDFLAFAANEKIKADQNNTEVAVSTLLSQMPPIRVPNYMYKNQGNLRFEQVSEAWGIDQDFQSNGAAYADLDMDGDLDLVVNNINDEAAIYRNQAIQYLQHHYLKIRLKGALKNTAGIGAEVCLITDEKKYWQTLIPSRGFQSAVEPVLNFGLGQDSIIQRIEILWPTGEKQIVVQPGIDTVLNIIQSGKQAELEPDSNEGIFTQAQMKNAFLHQENPFNDFNIQPLLPHFLSTQGPKIATGDVNGDNRTDFFIGGAKGRPGKIFLQTPSSEFVEFTQPEILADSMSEDLGAVFFDADDDGDSDLYVVSGGYGFQPKDRALKDRLYLNSGTGIFSSSPDRLPDITSSGSCVTAGDFDADGDIDLFVGGRLVPGNYPEIPESYLLENNGKGYFKDITEQINPHLRKPGMVTDALWIDINGDQRMDLVMVGEWMPVSIFINQDGKLLEANEQLGTSGTEGWWNKIIAGDFDGDGDQDLVVGNYGWNSQIKVSQDEPATLYAKDFDENGSVDPILCYYIQGKSYPMPSKDDLLMQLPHLKNKYVKYEQYADAGITDIFSQEELEDVDRFEAFQFSTAYLKNDDNKTLSLTPLPVESQMSPVFAIVSDDLDRDGNKDLILGGNLFQTRVKFGQNDANHGVVLSSDGNGNFTVIPSRQIGLLLKGEVRDMAIIKRDNGESTLLVARNNDYLLMFDINQISK